MSASAAGVTTALPARHIWRKAGWTFSCWSGERAWGGPAPPRGGEPERDAPNIAKLSKKDADALHDFDAYFERIAPLLKDMLFVIPSNLGIREVPDWLRLMWKFRRWGRKDLEELVRLFTISAADLLDEFFEDERVKGAFATQSVIGAWHGPMSPGSAYVLAHPWVGEMGGQMGAWGWVYGGMGGLSK